MTRITASIMAAYALLALILVPVFPHFVSPNETARWLLDASIMENHTLEVTRLLPLVGNRLEDLAAIDGRFYSNKAPGTMLLTLPAYRIARPFLGPPSPANMRPAITVMRLAAATLPLLLLAVLFLRLGRKWAVEERRIAFILWLLLFATPLFAYGLLLFSHALVAAALFGAWMLLYVEESHDCMAGALIGLAVAAEYPIVLAGAILILGLGRNWRRMAGAIAGGAPFAVALALYHRAAFGSIFVTPYQYGRFATLRSMNLGGLFGIHAPSPLRFLHLLFDPRVGLFVLAPVLVLAIPALISARSRLPVPALVTIIAVPLSMLLVYAGYEGWTGGWNVGPRYLVPVVPFLVAPLLLRRATLAEAVLAGASALAVFFSTIAFPFPPDAFAFPWMTLGIPLVGAGLIAPNLLHLVARPLAIAVPFALAGWAFVAATRTARRIIYSLIGALAMIVVGAQAERIAPAPLIRLERQYIEEVWFEQRGTIGEGAPPSLLRRREADLKLPPLSWPF